MLDMVFRHKYKYLKPQWALTGTKSICGGLNCSVLHNAINFGCLQKNFTINAEMNHNEPHDEIVLGLNVLTQDLNTLI